MSEEYGPDFITLSDEDGVEKEYEVLDAVEYEGKQYVALIPAEEDLLDALELLILEVQDDNGEDVLVSLEDEELYNELFDVFSERLDDERFYGGGEDDGKDDSDADEGASDAPDAG